MRITPTKKLSPIARRAAILAITSAERITPEILDKFRGVSDRDLMSQAARARKQNRENDEVLIEILKEKV